MSIYIDPLIAWPQKAASGSRYFGGGKQSCHMSCDGDLEELHQFAEKIGLRRAWFQDRPGLPHYDLTPSRRAAALNAGAIAVEHAEFFTKCRKPVEKAVQ